MIEPDPTKLAHKVADAVADLARCLATDVRIDPAHVIVPLILSMDDLHKVATELGLAAMSVDEEAAAAAHRAATHFLKAGAELTQAVVRLPETSPRGRLYGKRPGTSQPERS